ncbi:MAG: response regulator, partial [Gammaproteobacteria bacterium]|nr:response regulator [Gammaproteobacteria bacterium]
LVTKPVVASSLYDAIAGLMGVARKQRVSQRLRGPQVDSLIGAHILLVEDHRMNQELAVELLTRNGMHVTVANDGAEALNTLETARFDGVLMDAQMPVMDGYEATRLIRAQARFADLPVIAMTANAMTGDRERCLDAGMNDHIPKPVNVQQMLSTMARWIRPTGAAAERGAPPGDDAPGDSGDSQRWPALVAVGIDVE